MSVTSTLGYRPRAAAGERAPSVLGVIGALVVGLYARLAAGAGASVVRALLDVAGLAAITWGVYQWHAWLGWVVGGLAALIFSARLSP